MGNALTKKEELSAASIEMFYAKKAVAAKSDCIEGQCKSADLDEKAAENHENTNAPNWSRSGLHSAQKLRALVPSNKFVSASVYITKVTRTIPAQAVTAFNGAIKKLKKISITVSAWIKAHPWETAALVLTVILVACLPAFLTAAGFTAGGIAAGSLAAGIQAGIGSVAAGSAFAIFTSAMMGGYGVILVFVAPLIILCAGFSTLLLLKRWFRAGNNHTARTNTGHCAIVDKASDGDTGPMHMKKD